MKRLLVLSVLAPGLLHASAFERGMKAKAAGDLSTAATELATAVKETPSNPEAWLHYGTVLGWQKRYPEGRQAIERGLAIAPRDFDLRLAHARLLAWQEDFGRADAILASLAKEFPGNNDIEVLQGQLAGWTHRPDEAERHYRAVLGRDPQQVDALTGLGALERDRHSPATARWRWDGGVTASHFDADERPDWWSVWTQLSRESPIGTWWGRIEQQERFEHQDTTLEAGWARTWEDAFEARVFGGGSPDADWAARGYFESNFAWHPCGKPWPWLVAEIRYSEFVPRHVWTFRTGINQDFGDGWRLALRWTHLEFQGGEPTDGWIASIEREFGDGWWWRVGTASGAESITGESLQSDSVLRSQTWFAGLRGPLTETWGWRADIEREEVAGGPDRTGVSFGVHHRF
jgi:YaiO family outer membrane protein